MSLNPLGRPRRAHAAVLLLGALTTTAACKPEESTAPASVITVSVSPEAAALGVGDSLALAVVARGNDGPVNDPPAWASSAPAIATVSTSGLVRALAAGTASITATVRGQSASARVTVEPGRFGVEAAQSVASVGPAGGTLSVSSAAGISYDLIVPAFALSEPTTLRLAPVSRFSRLPFSGGLIGAVVIEPSDLRLDRLARLRIRRSANPVAPQRLIGLWYRADADSLLPTIGISNDDVVTVLVQRGGVVGAAFGTAAEADVLLPSTGLSAGERGRARLAGVALPADRDLFEARIQEYGRANWAGMRQGTGPEAIALRATLIWDEWENARAAIDPAASVFSQAVGPEWHFGLDNATALLREGIADLDQRCRMSQDPFAAARILSLQRLAEAMLLPHYDKPYSAFEPGRAADLTADAVRTGLCIRVVATDTTFPASPTANVATQVQLGFAVQFVGTAARLPMPFQVEIDQSGTTADGLSSKPTDDQGRLVATITPTGQKSLTITGTACIRPTNTLAAGLELVCGTVAIVRPVGRTIVGSVNVGTPADLAALADVARVTGSIDFEGFQGNISPDLRELARLTEVGQISLFGVAVSSLAGMTSLIRADGLFVELPAASGTLRLPPRLASVNRLYLSGPFSAVEVPPNLHLVQDLAIYDAQVHSLQEFRAVVVERLFAVSGTPELRSLSGLTFPRQFDGHITVGPGVTKLADLAALRGLTSAANLALHLDGPETTLPELINLQRVIGDLEVDGPAVVGTYGLANLARAGGISVNPALLSGLAVFELPSLTQVDFSLSVNQGSSGCARATPFSVALTGLLSVGGGVRMGRVNAPVACRYDVQLPALRAVGAGSSFGGDVLVEGDGPRRVVLGGLQLNGRVMIERAHDLEELSFTGPIAASILSIGSNPTLTRIDFGGPLDVMWLTITTNDQLAQVNNATGRAKGLTVSENPRLSTQAIKQWANAMTVTDFRDIHDNGNP